MSDLEKFRPSTLVVSAGRPAHSAGAPVNTPLSLSSTFHSGGSDVYLRDGSPTTCAFEAAIGLLEGGEAVSFGSGMAAVAAVLDGLPVGTRVVAPDSMYWGSVDLLRRSQQLGRLSVTTVDITDTESVLAAIPGAGLVWIETPSNPLISIADVPTICAAAREAGALSCVDSTFATPLLQRPLEQGADVVMHSATKFIGGHSDLLMGLLISHSERADGYRSQRARTGAVAGALESFLALRGLRTLDVRLRRQMENASILAERLSEHPAVRRVRYPGLAGDPGFELATQTMDGPGAMLAFELGSGEAADALCERVELISSATSLGGVESLIERRAKYEGERSLGTPAGLLRFSVGIEDAEDLWADLLTGLSD
jgi:cystathionine gamma-synthase